MADEELGPLERELERVAAEARELQAEVEKGLRPEDRDLAAQFVHAQLGEDTPGAAEGGEGGRLLRMAPWLAAAAALVLWFSWGALFPGGPSDPDGVFVGNDRVTLLTPEELATSFALFEWEAEELPPGQSWRLEVQTSEGPGWRTVLDQTLAESRYRPTDEELATLGSRIRWRASYTSGHRSSGWREATLGG